MSLRIVYGKAGCGKSTFLFNEIAAKINDNKINKIYIITPEQFSFTAEKKLLNAIKENAVLKAEVLTFNRMAYRILNSVGGATKTNLSECGKSVLIYNILLGKKEQLKFIGKSNENVEMISTQITEFKKHGINVSQLENVYKNTKNEYLKNKIKDMLLVYKEYEQTIENEYIDENDNLTLLSQKLAYTNEFENCEIYIDEFVGFTKQEYEIIRELARVAKQITITACTDEIAINKEPDTDLFYSNKQTISRLYQMAEEENIIIDEPVLVNNKQKRFKNEELQHVEENLYAIPYKKYTQPVKNISLFLANNFYSEVEYVASQIIKLVREEKYRYNDIAIISKNLENYSSLCKAIFNEYKIPYFLDEKKDLSQNVLTKFILALLNIFAKNWSYEAVFEYVKAGLLPIDEHDIYLLENYCLRWGIRGNKWHSKEWTFYEETQEEIERILHAKQIVLEPLIKLKNELTGSKDVQKISEKLYLFLIENEIEKSLEKKIQELNEIGEIEKAKEYETSWKIIIEVLDEIVLVLGNQKVSFEKYADLLKMGLRNSSLGKIPGTQDQVVIGDIDRSRSHKVRAVFMLGLNDGMFPSINKKEGFFNDKDREKLKEQGAELAKGTLEKLYDDNFNIYKAFTTAEEKIYLSYASTDSEGKSLRASILINRIKKIFPNLVESSDIINKNYELVTQSKTFEELLNKISLKREGEEIEPIWEQIYQYYLSKDEWKVRLEKSLKALNYTNEPENIQEKNIEKLYGKTLKTSVSRLEQYQSCPFSYYLKYGLKLNEKNTFKIQAVDTGTFMHEIIDTFFEKTQENGIKIKEISNEQIAQIIDEIIEEKLNLKKNYIFKTIPKYKVLVLRLTKLIKRAMKYIVESLKYSDFEVLGHEIEFKQGKEYSPIRVDLENGKKVEIIGKIDRIDIAKTPERKIYKNNRLQIIYKKYKFKRSSSRTSNTVTYIFGCCVQNRRHASSRNIIF